MLSELVGLEMIPMEKVGEYYKGCNYFPFIYFLLKIPNFFWNNSSTPEMEVSYVNDREFAANDFGARSGGEHFLVFDFLKNQLVKEKLIE